MMIPSSLIIFVGGGLGAIARHIVASMTAQMAGTGFPWGTLAVNLIGAILIGIVVEMLALKTNLAPEWRLFLVTGILGGFTTFSAFSLETSLMLTRGDYTHLIAYITLSVAGSIALFLGATTLIRQIF
jgi:fluoride exporter